ncbi:MAG: methyltransferase domain-containing protein [Candidatus Moraniibacteriota bacterium]
MEEQDVSYGVKFINPKLIIDSLEIGDGMVVGDFGCGTGYFTFPLAQKVGQTGLVYALDILKDKLETIESEAKILGLSNILAKRVNLEKIGGSKIEDENLDWVFLINMLFQNKDREIIIQEAKRVLKTGGKVLVIEWNKENASFGLADNLRVSQMEISDLAQKNGFAITKEIKVSDFHFGIILEK